MFAIWLYVGFDNILLSVMYAGIVGYLYYAMCEYLDSVPTRKKEPIHERYIVGTAISFVLFVLIPSNLVPAIRPWIEISSTTLSAAVMPEDSVSSFRVIFEMYMAVGITTWLVSQAFINIAVNTALFPVTGITLPFVSYGGSSLVAS